MSLVYIRNVVLQKRVLEFRRRITEIVLLVVEQRPSNLATTQGHAVKGHGGPTYSSNVTKVCSSLAKCGRTTANVAQIGQICSKPPNIGQTGPNVVEINRNWWNSAEFCPSSPEIWSKRVGIGGGLPKLADIGFHLAKTRTWLNVARTWPDSAKLGQSHRG